MNSKVDTKSVAFAGMIAALYVAMTYLSSILGLSSGVIQVRFSESLNTLTCFTGAAVPGLFLGCIAANLLTGGCVIDMIFGSLATLIGAFIGRKIAIIEDGKYNMLVPIPTIIANIIVVPFVLKYGYNINLPYQYMAITVGLGEIISAGLIGMFVYFTLLRIPQFRQIVKSVEQYPDMTEKYDDNSENIVPKDGSKDTDNKEG